MEGEMRRVRLERILSMLAAAILIPACGGGGGGGGGAGSGGTLLSISATPGSATGSTAPGTAFALRPGVR